MIDEKKFVRTLYTWKWQRQWYINCLIPNCKNNNSDDFFIHWITDLIALFPVQMQENKNPDKIEVRKTMLLT